MENPRNYFQVKKELEEVQAEYLDFKGIKRYFFKFFPTIKIIILIHAKRNQSSFGGGI